MCRGDDGSLRCPVLYHAIGELCNYSFERRHRRYDEPASEKPAAEGERRPDRLGSAIGA